jgi:hypothetical protein
MNQHVSPQAAILQKADPAHPVFALVGTGSLVVRAGTVFAGTSFDRDTHVPVPMNEEGQPGYVTGADYVIRLVDGNLAISRLSSAPSFDDPTLIGGFHFAPGGNATGRSGGDSIPQISPFSLWDIAFRPACPDPRGMVLVEGRDGRFWCDIYLLGVDHIDAGTSAYGVTIADGNDPPQKSGGKRFKKLDYETAVAVMAHHGKGLLSYDEFIAATHGVTEQTSASGDPGETRLDAPRSSARGVMQATGNLWVWGHDGDPDTPRASVCGGSWWSGDGAGSRHAIVAYDWPDYSSGSVGARGRGDHLQLG